MTFREFKRRTFAISREEFRGLHFHPLDHGIERTCFEEKKLLRLIAMGDKTKFATAKRKVESWQRQLERVRKRRQQLQNTKAGIFGPATS